MADIMLDVRFKVRDLKWYEIIMAVIMIGIAGWVMINAVFIDPDSSSNPGWLTVVNFISALAGVACVFLCARASISNFIFAVVNTVSYMIYLFYWNIYGTFALELFVYLPMNFISWGIWRKHRDREFTDLTKSKRLSPYGIIFVTAAVVLSGLVYNQILSMYDDPVALLDAYTVAIGLVAIAMQCLRYREQYILWLITDFVAVAMFVVHFDPVYLTKKTIYLIVAIIGLYNWWKLNRERNKENE